MKTKIIRKKDGQLLLQEVNEVIHVCLGIMSWHHHALSYGNLEHGVCGT